MQKLTEDIQWDSETHFQFFFTKKLVKIITQRNFLNFGPYLSFSFSRTGSSFRQSVISSFEDILVLSCVSYTIPVPLRSASVSQGYYY